MCIISNMQLAKTSRIISPKCITAITEEWSFPHVAVRSDELE